MQNQTPKELFLATLRKIGKKNITWDDIKVVEVLPSIGAQGTNTLVRIAADPQGNYRGNTPIRIIRTDVAELFQGIDVTLDPKDYYNTVELLPDLARIYGLHLEHTDIINSQLPRKDDTEVLIRMAPTNLALVGVLKVKLEDTGRDIGKLFVKDIIETPLISDTPNMINGEFLHRNLDFTSSLEELSLMRTGPAHIGEILEILNIYDEVDWVMSTKPCKFNLHGALVIAAQDSTVLGKVVKVKLNPNYCTNIKGNLELHFRDE